MTEEIEEMVSPNDLDDKTNLDPNEEKGKPKVWPHLNICKDESFDVSKPYLYIGNIDPSHKHSIYCDGSYSLNRVSSLCCIGGLIFDETTFQVVGEFYEPLNTKDAKGQEFQPDFENQAVKKAIEISEVLKLRANARFANIYNDRISVVKSHNHKYQDININVKWIPRYVNQADAIVSFARELWKKQYEELMGEYKKIHQTFYLQSNNKIVITHNHMKKWRTQYYTAFNFDTHEAIASICLNEEPYLGEIKLATKMLKDGLVEDVGFIFSKDTKEILNSYRNHRNDAQELDDFFSAAGSHEHPIAIESIEPDSATYQKLLNYAQKSFSKMMNSMSKGNG